MTQGRMNAYATMASRKRLLCQKLFELVKPVVATKYAPFFALKGSQGFVKQNPGPFTHTLSKNQVKTAKATSEIVAFALLHDLCISHGMG